MPFFSGLKLHVENEKLRGEKWNYIGTKWWAK
jgi:hypothetical protein